MMLRGECHVDSKERVYQVWDVMLEGGIYGSGDDVHIGNGVGAFALCVGAFFGGGRLCIFVEAEKAVLDQDFVYLPARVSKSALHVDFRAEGRDAHGNRAFLICLVLRGCVRRAHLGDLVLF